MTISNRPFESHISDLSLNDRAAELDAINTIFSREHLRDIRVPGSGEQRFFLMYCAAITRLPMAISQFMVVGKYFEERYLRRLKKRDETHFAVAAHDCFSSEEFWEAMRLPRHFEGEGFSVYPQLESTFVFARSPRSEKEMVFVDRVVFKHLVDFYTYDLFNGLHHGHAPSRCQGCGKYFLTTNGHMPKYCDGIAPQDSRMTCRQYGAMLRQKERNDQHPVYRLFSIRTNTIRKHHQRGKITDELREAALRLAEQYRDRALMDNAYADDGYERDMEQEHIYREARKRLV